MLNTTVHTVALLWLLCAYDVLFAKLCDISWEPEKRSGKRNL